MKEDELFYKNEFMLKKLSSLSHSLRLYGLIISLLTLVNIVLAITILTARVRVFSYSISIYYIDTYLILLVSFIVFVIIVIFLYERARKSGEVLFEEISDELQWNIGYRKSKTENIKRPDVNVRVILRTFARTTDLPLVSGKFGPAVFFFFNILLLFVAIFVLTPIY